MKKWVVVCLMMLAVTYKSFSQVSHHKGKTKQDYLQRSEYQKTEASILLGGGVALIATGVFVNFPARSGSFDDVAAKGGMVFLGTLASITSVPFFIASGKNKRRA